MNSPSFPPTRSGGPSWVWPCTFCAILPLVLVGVLIVLLIPGLRSIRQTARERRMSGECQDNLRQVCQAIQLYAQDNDDRYPLRANWMDSTYLYVRDQKIYQCPSVKAKKQGESGYAFDSRLAAATGKKIKAPALTWLVFDSSSLSRNASDPITSLPKPARHIYRDPGNSRRSKDEHDNMVGFVDGHVLAMPLESVPPLPVVK